MPRAASGRAARAHLGGHVRDGCDQLAEEAVEVGAVVRRRVRVGQAALQLRERPGVPRGRARQALQQRHRRAPHRLVPHVQRALQHQPRRACAVGAGAGLKPQHAHSSAQERCQGLALHRELA